MTADQTVTTGTTTNAQYPPVAPTTTAQPPITVINQPPQGQYFTADQLEAARQQEKDKLYPKMTQMESQLAEFKTEVDTLRAERDQRAKDAADAQKAVADAQRAAEEEKLSVKELLDRRDQEWQAQLAEEKQQLETQRTLMQKEHDFMALQSFIQRRVAEEVAADNIIPDLVEFIGGNTEEEVEQSIIKVKEKTASIIEGTNRLNSGIPNPVQPGVSPTGFAPAGPLDTLTGQKQYTAEEIAAMDMQEYAKYRAQSGINKAGNNRGLFN